jgi:AAA domain
MEDNMFSSSTLLQSVADNEAVDFFTRWSLNDSQLNAVLDCASSRQKLTSSLKLIWGPPGTGKTKTISMILIAMLIKNSRTVTCAPTNTAVVEVASRLQRLVEDSSDLFQGDVVLFGNKDRMRIDAGLSKIFLEDRAARLLKCFMPHTGIRHCISSMIDTFEKCDLQYQSYLNILKVSVDECSEVDDKCGEEMEDDLCRAVTEDVSGEAMVDKCCELTDDECGEIVEGDLCRTATKDVSGETMVDNCSELMEDDGCREVMSLAEYVKSRFVSLAQDLKYFIEIFLDDYPRTLISQKALREMHDILDLLPIMEELLQHGSKAERILEMQLKIEVLSTPVITSVRNLTKVLARGDISFFHLVFARDHFLEKLRLLSGHLTVPDIYLKRSVEEFVLQHAKSVLCTACSSFRLHGVKMDPKIPSRPLQVLVVDEAAQLKESESLIPLLLPGIKNVVLIGDEFQLPALVKSKVCVSYKYIETIN